MSSLSIRLLQNFLSGGLFIAIVSYVATYMNPVAGAILWSYPFSLLPTLYFMKGSGQSNIQISKFTLIGTFAILLEIIGTYCLAYFMANYKDDPHALTKSIIKSVGIWLIVGLLYYKAVYYFKLQDKFL